MLLATMLLALAGCAGNASRAPTRWDAYYARAARPRAHVVVMPPEGASVPMAKLIARYVVNYLNKQDILAEVGGGAAGASARDTKTKNTVVFVLSGVVEENTSNPRIRYRRILRWMVSDVNGRVIATHAQGIDGTRREWDFGSARLLNAIGFDAAGPLARIVRGETQSTISPAAPSRRRVSSGVLLESVSGVSAKDAKVLMTALKKALRETGVLVTGDERQAAYRLRGAVESSRVSPKRIAVRIVWTVATLERTVVGRAFQENTVRVQDLKNGWSQLAPRVGAAAAVGVERILGRRPGGAPGIQDHTGGAPPVIVLPGVSGRAPPPPR